MSTDDIYPDFRFLYFLSLPSLVFGETGLGQQSIYPGNDLCSCLTVDGLLYVSSRRRHKNICVILALFSKYFADGHKFIHVVNIHLSRWKFCVINHFAIKMEEETQTYIKRLTLWFFLSWDVLPHRPWNRHFYKLYITLKN